MVEFLPMEAACGEIVKVIIDARKFIIIISPFLDFPEKIYSHLKYASKERGILVEIYYRKKKATIQEAKRVAEELKYVNLYCVANLHSKCYYNENKMVVSSLNLLKSSWKKNWEMGFLIEPETSIKDKNLYDKVIENVETMRRSGDTTPIHETADEYDEKLLPAIDWTIMNSSQEIKVKPENFKEQRSGIWLCKLCGFELMHNTDSNKTLICPECGKLSLRPIEERGFCIGCRKFVFFNVKTPFCTVCYYKHEKGKFCLKCGEESNVSRENPLCDSCS
ncbi:MAG: phosphatidylserine/phosphatidylglycerophosphate/cardiolipin synthase family protein [Candidatus Lokiarchaeota archaeon]|nr:phosphatidylserine/phosphatidylglycerophosphate/cardiolipin synthase family protein [Candidatus Lokiarchaeota archaeon]